MKRFSLLLLLVVGSMSMFAQGADPRINYDESKVPSFVLPSALMCNDGTMVTTVEEWETKRRPEILAMFENQFYGKTPTEKIPVSYKVLYENPNTIKGKATCKQVQFTFSNGKKEISAILLMYIPNRVKGKVPVIVSYNFQGNPSTTEDNYVLYSPGMKVMYSEDSPNMTTRGLQKSRWNYEIMIDRGYAVATMCYHDIFPDKPEHFSKSVASLFKDFSSASRDYNEWGAIGIWAWGSSRIMDYLMTDPRIDSNRVALMGHSRQGKAALWAGAQDRRFKIVFSNDSGCGGAALSKRVYGENLSRMIHSFPHWLCVGAGQWAGNEASMPFDSHELLDLIAPNHVYVASAQEDNWADQKGEYLAAYYTKDVYALYGMKGFDTVVPPGIHQPRIADMGYHIRAGIHDVTDYDWTCYCDFCDKYLK